MKIKKRILTIAPVFMAIAALLSMGINVLAATAYPWGPQWFTPYTGIASITSTSFRGGALYWSQDSIDEYGNGDYWELEARDDDMSLVWGNSTGSVSNLPGFYTETGDTDDRSIGCNSVKDLYADEAYYGQINFNSKNTYEDKTLIIESEYGWWLGFDGYPYGYEQNETTLYGRTFKTSLEW